MSLEALLIKLEARSVTPVTASITTAVTANPLQINDCTAVTPVTVENPLPETIIQNLSDWKNHYHALVAQYDRQGSNHRDNEWQAINQAFLACCRTNQVAFDSDRGFEMMNQLITITEFNKGYRL